MTIISREQWGARHGDGVGTAWPTAETVWLHHSVTIAPDLVPPFDDDYEAIRTIERIGAQRFGTAYGFPYTFAVTPAGLVFAGHNLRKCGAHTAGHNASGRGICLVGNYQEDTPTDEQAIAVGQLLAYGAHVRWWKRPALTGGHRDVKKTACPGDKAYALIPSINEYARYTPEDDDMSKAAEDAIFAIKGALDDVGKQTAYGAKHGKWDHHTDYAATVADTASIVYLMRQELKALTAKVDGLTPPKP